MLKIWNKKHKTKNKLKRLFGLFLYSKNMNYDEENLFKIYAVYNDIDNVCLYVGCTVQDLDKRLYQHSHDKKSSIYEIINNIGQEHISIVALTEYYGYLKEAHYIEEQYSKLFNEDQELFNKKFGDVIRNKIKLKRPKPQSQGIKNLLKYK